MVLCGNYCRRDSIGEYNIRSAVENEAGAEMEKTDIKIPVFDGQELWHVEKTHHAIPETEKVPCGRGESKTPRRWRLVGRKRRARNELRIQCHLQQANGICV